MTNLEFKQADRKEGFVQLWAAEADCVQWEIRCQGLDQNGQGSICSFFKKTEGEPRFRAVLGKRIRLEDAKEFVSSLHTEELQNGPIRRDVLQQPQRSGMPGLIIIAVEQTYNEIQRGQKYFSSPGEKQIAEALRNAMSSGQQSL